MNPSGIKRPDVLQGRKQSRARKFKHSFGAAPRGESGLAGCNAGELAGAIVPTSEMSIEAVQACSFRKTLCLLRSGKGLGCCWWLGGHMKHMSTEVHGGARSSPPGETLDVRHLPLSEKTQPPGPTSMKTSCHSQAASNPVGIRTGGTQCCLGYSCLAEP
jgi:hypothetical protein